MPPDPPTIGRTYKCYEAPGTRPPIFLEVSATDIKIDLDFYVRVRTSKKRVTGKQP